MDVIECIKTRRSIRKYTDQWIDPQLIKQILDISIAAPSGKNGQPWKFKVITDSEIVNRIAELTIYSRWSRRAPCLLFVFLNKDQIYDYIKDVQSCGAVIQNILLCANSMGISSCWVGEILEQSEKVINILNLSSCNVELMAMVTLGYGVIGKANLSRKNIEEFMVEMSKTGD